MTIIGCIVACQPKQNGYRLTLIDLTGNRTNVHTFLDLTYCCDYNSVWELECDVKVAGLYPVKYFVLVGTPKQVDSLNNQFKEVPYTYRANRPSYQALSQGLENYLANPDLKKRNDEAFVWNRRKRILADVDDLDKHSNTDWTDTFNAKPLEGRDDDFLETLKQNVWQNGNQLGYYNRLASNTLEDSLSTLVLSKEEYDTLDVNTFPKTGVSAYIDSVTAAIAVREGHVADFFSYFALITYLKRSKSFPTTSVQNALKFFWRFLYKHRKHKAKHILISLQKCGLIEIEGNPKKPEDLLDQSLCIRSQQEYARKWESAYNARARNANRGVGIYKRAIKRCADDLKWITYKTQPTSEHCVVSPIKNPEIYGAFRPYFTLFAYKSVKMDTGFINLLNAPHGQMRSFLYEVIVSSFNGYPICRTRFATNFGISKNTQLLYERQNKSIQKHFNHLEITDDMWEQMNGVSRNQILKDVQLGSKFKISPKTGKLYRQEGNSFRSKRFPWKSSQQCARLKLSQKIVRHWFAVEPVFNEIVKDDKITYSEPFLPEVQKDLLAGKFKRTLVTKKKELSEHFFALHFKGVAIPTTDKKAWRDFEPLTRLHCANGNRVVPHQNSLANVRTIARIARDFDSKKTSYYDYPDSTQERYGFALKTI